MLRVEVLDLLVELARKSRLWLQEERSCLEPPSCVVRGYTLTAIGRSVGRRRWGVCWTACKWAECTRTLIAKLFPFSRRDHAGGYVSEFLPSLSCFLFVRPFVPEGRRRRGGIHTLYLAFGTPGPRRWKGSIMQLVVCTRHRFVSHDYSPVT